MSSQIMNIGGFSGEEQTKIYGQLLTLFGEPLYITQNCENAYSYLIMATHSDGTQYVLNVYQGPSGAAIGGGFGISGIQDAAEELACCIRNAETTDFEWVGYYMDGPSKIHQKIENGKISYEETEIKDDDEYEKARKICYS